MDKVLSIDLAYKNACDLGICLLESKSSVLDATFLPFWKLGIENPPGPKQLAFSIHSFCRDQQIPIVMLDGPQGWKDRTSDLPHMRMCEKELKTPAKTGVLGHVKPKNYGPFVQFSVNTFEELANLGASLLLKTAAPIPPGRLLAVESFPMSAWRSLGIKPLPAKRKAGKPGAAEISERFRQLQELFGLRALGHPSHDELQACVSALGGLALLEGNVGGYIAKGSPPKKQDGVIVEGFIVNPRR